jgi:hypothetical protein
MRNELGPPPARCIGEEYSPCPGFTPRRGTPIMASLCVPSGTTTEGRAARARVGEATF